jgi:hypothetical protein
MFLMCRALRAYARIGVQANSIYGEFPHTKLRVGRRASLLAATQVLQ